MLDTFFQSLSYVCAQLLPIIGAVALIFLCVMLYKAWQLIDEMTARVKGLEPTLKKVDQSMDKLQEPLDMVVNYSRSLDDLQDKTRNRINNVVSATNEKTAKAKDYMNDKLEKLQAILKEKKEKLHESEPAEEVTEPDEPVEKEDTPNE